MIASGGSVDTNIGPISVNPTGDLDAVDELNAIVVRRADEAPVYSSDLGIKVVRGIRIPPLAITRFPERRVGEVGRARVERGPCRTRSVSRRAMTR